MKRKAGQTRRAPGADATTAESAGGELPPRATIAVYADCVSIPAQRGSGDAAESAEPIWRRAAQLAAQLGLPLVPAHAATHNMAADPAHDIAGQRVPDLAGAAAYDLLLTVTAERVELRCPQRGGPRPLYVDFVAGPLGYARRVNRFGLLFQAVGFRSGRPTVLDATAGLGRDAFWLAYHGCRVTALERSPVLFALLQDGLERAARVPEIREHLGDRLRLLHADARVFLRQLAEKCATSAPACVSLPEDAPDVVYLDPMYPPQRKSALVKVEMRILRQLVGDDPDAGELFELACAVARQRVVVKRHRHAEPLSPDPTHSHSDQTTRYDVYVRLFRREDT